MWICIFYGINLINIIKNRSKEILYSIFCNYFISNNKDDGNDKINSLYI